MDNEATRLINEEAPMQGQNNVNSNSKADSEKSETPKAAKAKMAAAAVGGFFVGGAAGMAASASAAENNPEEVLEVAAETPQEEAVPEPEQVILANDEGIRYAHVDADNFSDAFAQARQQVGPGGVFEYNGRLYGTYYINEWNDMTAQEKADYQSRVNEVAPSHHSASHESSSMAEHQEDIPSNGEYISAEPVDGEIRVLGVEAIETEDGPMHIGLVEIEGERVLLADIDNDGRIDFVAHDDNGDGQIQDGEIFQVPDGTDLTIEELMQAQAAQEGGFYASYDEGPDYVSDADSIMSV
ncbi:MAG: hypothetical protein K2K59_01345 [Muribaculaceae bacterium]|nr:hypothetical protein [Muribaculaceae bacterium]